MRLVAYVNVTYMSCKTELSEINHFVILSSYVVFLGKTIITVPLSTRVYKRVPANIMLGGNPTMDQHPIQGGVEIFLVASC